ncbi:MAG: hypothetical protein QNJ55_22530 [Xenococcus sp. MO_188.B8]|nr:hypothetical protein [Xenococcus sp. MO_188.B8]
MTSEQIESDIKQILNKLELVNDKLELVNDKLEIYKKNGDEINASMRSEIKAYQDANKQQLNVSLGILVTASIAILVSVILSMN